MRFKSISESLENYNCYSIKYNNTHHEPKKDQIKADAMVYIIRFIDWCCLKEGKNDTKNNKRRYY